MTQAALEQQAPAVLRPYQDECLRKLVDYRMRGGRRALITLATGLGKTTIFSQLARAQKRMLVIAHREELLDQAAARIATDVPGTVIGVEQAGRRADDGAKVVVASVQTLAMSPERLRRFNPADFSAIVVDEAHHSTARTYLDVLAHFGLAPDVSDLKDSDLAKRQLNEQVARRFKTWQTPPEAPFLVGCTATPSRTDGRGLEWVFDDIVFSMDIRLGIEQQWLSPIKGIRVRTGSSLADVKTRAGDFVESQLSAAVNNDDRNALLVHSYEDHMYREGVKDRASLFGVPDDAPRRQALVFCVDRDHAASVLESFQRRGHKAGLVLGNTPAKERQSTVNAYRRGDLRVLVGVMVFTEGFDAPETEMVIMARPTKSSLIYTQALGRCTRRAPGKDYALVIDLEDAGKSGVQNLNTMFGLPPKLHTGDADVTSVQRAIEEYEGQVSEQRLLDAESIADVQRMSEEFDPVAVAGLPPWVEQNTTMAWIKTNSGYALSLMGRGDMGVVIDTLGHARVRFRPRGAYSDKPVDVGQFDGEQEGLQAGEDWIRGKHDDVARLAQRNASWRASKAEATVAQRNFLARLGKRDLPAGLTKGQASLLIERELVKKG